MKGWFKGLQVKAGLFDLLDPVSWHGVTNDKAEASLSGWIPALVPFRVFAGMTSTTGCFPCTPRQRGKSMTALALHRHPVPRHGVQPI